MCACFLLFAADSLGRRRSLLWTSIAMGCAMLYVGLYVRIKPPVKGADIPGAGYMALVCIYLFAGFFQWGWGPVPWIYISEIPTARLRSVNVALGAATQWVSFFLEDEYRIELTCHIAIQPCCCSSSPKHARHHGKGRLWHIPFLLRSLFPLLPLRLVLVGFVLSNCFGQANTLTSFFQTVFPRPKVYRSRKWMISSVSLS
jgi:hypothetical protein